MNFPFPAGQTPLVRTIIHRVPDLSRFIYSLPSYQITPLLPSNYYDESNPLNNVSVPVTHLTTTAYINNHTPTLQTQELKGQKKPIYHVNSINHTIIN